MLLQDRNVALLIVLSAIISWQRISADCGDLPVVPDSTHDANPSYSPGSTVVYTCDMGFEFTGLNSTEVTAVCRDDDMWSDVPDCDVVSCPSLPGDAVLSSMDTTYGSEVVMSCADSANERIPGVPVGASLTLTCEANGTWSGGWNGGENVTEACVEIMCPYPMENSIGDLTGDEQSTARGVIASFECAEPYYYSYGDIAKLFRCNSDGIWEEVSSSRTDVRCVADECEPLRDLYSLAHVDLDPPTQYAGEDVVARCITGYNWNDTSTEKQLTCFDNMTWSHYGLFDCEPKVCPEVFELTHGNSSSTDNWYPVWVNFTCWPGYWFPDGDTSRMSQCNEHGKWSEIIPQCTNESLVIETDFKEEEFAADNADRYTYIAAGIGCTVLILIVVSDIVTFPRQISFLMRNFRSRCKCLQKPEDDKEELNSLDGEEVMRASALTIQGRGTGKITPAPIETKVSYEKEDSRSTDEKTATPTPTLEKDV